MLVEAKRWIERDSEELRVPLVVELLIVVLGVSAGFVEDSVHRFGDAELRSPGRHPLFDLVQLLLKPHPNNLDDSRGDPDCDVVREQGDCWLEWRWVLLEQVVKEEDEQDRPKDAPLRDSCFDLSRT